MTDERFQKVREKAQAALDSAEGFSHRVLLDFGQDGVLLVDGPEGVVHPDPDDRHAACTINVSLANFVKLAKGELDPARAVLSRKVKVKGDLALAIRLATRMRQANGGRS